MNKYKYMIEEGIDFDTIKDINKLAIYLGSDMKKVMSIDLSIALLIGLINTWIVFILNRGRYYFLYIIVVLISSFLFVLLHFLKNYNQRRIEYFKAIEDKYVNLFDKYKGYDFYIAGFVQNSKNKFRTNTVILLTNEYRFILIEDPFAYSGYTIGKNDVKVLSERVYDLMKKEFKLTDILNYKLNGKVINAGQIYNTSFENKRFDTISITLKDFDVIELSTNIYSVLTKNLALKEIKDEK